jgi:hypothetical protein
LDAITILAALAPLGVDLGKSIIAKFFGQEEFKPASVDDWLKMRGVDMDMFKTMNTIGGETYKWVEAVIKLQRPTVAAVALIVWAYSHTVGTPSADINNFAAVIGFYLFGDRTLFHLKKKSAAK